MAPSCPGCKSPTAATDRFCGECGAPLPRPPAAGREPAPGAQAGGARPRASRAAPPPRRRAPAGNPAPSRRTGRDARAAAPGPPPAAPPGTPGGAGHGRAGNDEETAREHLLAGFRRFVLERTAVAARTALPEFEAAIRAAPEMPAPYVGKALCLAYRDALAEALVLVDTALRLGFGEAAHPALTVTADRPGSPGEALVLVVDRPWVLLVRADVLLGLGRDQEALDQADRVLEIGISGEHEADLDAIRTIALVRLGRLAEAEAALADADPDDPSGRLAEAWGRLHLAAGRPHAAVAALTRALAAAPEDADYLVLRASALAQTDRTVEARADLEAALRLLEGSQAPASEIGEVRQRLASL